MKNFSSLEKIPKDAKGAVIAIGNFDGVHKGHQQLLRRTKQIADKNKTTSAALTFEPHPRHLFRPDEPPGRITPAPVKAWRMEENGIDTLFSLTFDWDFASQSAEQFIQNILKDGLDAVHVVVGSDFRFGQLRAGSAETIRAAGIDVTVVDPVTSGDVTISSSRIRQHLRIGELEKANDLLGWNWEMRGTVFRGDRRGHDLGYPTANILLDDTLHPAYGVYAARVQIEGESEWRPAAVNIGIRPMFEVTEGQIEAHILDFPERDIYGKILRVQPVQRLRSEAKFGSLDALKDQMEKDCAQTRLILAGN